MGRAMETQDLDIVTLKNSTATTSINAFAIVKLNTTEGGCATVGTKGTVIPFGVAQAEIPGSGYGPVAIAASGGISRVKWSGTAYTTINLDTTEVVVCANASGRGKRATTSTYWIIGRMVSVAAASDIVPVALCAAKRYTS